MLCGAAERRTLKLGREPTWTRDSGSRSLEEMGRSCGQNRISDVGTRCNNLGRKDRHEDKWAMEDLVGRHAQESSRTMVTSNQKMERMEQIHTTLVKPMLQIPQALAESGYTSVFSDVSTNLTA